MTHAAVAWGLARALRRGAASGQDQVVAGERETLASLLAMLPDADVLAFRFGIPYTHALGHRGLSHSLVAGAVLGVLAWGILRARTIDAAGRPTVRPRDALVLVAAACSHGLLDMLTDGGEGVAILGPFDLARYFFELRPVPVSPIGVLGFLADGWPVLAWEVALLWPVGAAGVVVGANLTPRRTVLAVALCALALAVAWFVRLR
jgi:inner membrane protein